ncbi:hypothetical protein ACFFWC_12225 [Plantactinospora siamensis]|uniref:Secreted protein n=1 Tax=Plantactinospora siamensis TaxID=555372 RepID=A0ABV6P1M3_9ACTN
MNKSLHPVLTAGVALIVLLAGSPASAAPAKPVAPAPPASAAPPPLTDVTTPVVTRASSGPISRISSQQYAQTRAAAGRPLSANEQVALASSSCWTWSRSQWKDNIYGGTLMRLNGTINWCQDGSSVWGGGYNWSTYTNFGWSFDKWTNSPTGYYNPSRTRYDTVAQAKFCISWCAGTSYIGLDLWGDAWGSYGSSNL